MHLAQIRDLEGGWFFVDGVNLTVTASRWIEKKGAHQEFAVLFVWTDNGIR